MRKVLNILLVLMLSGTMFGQCRRDSVKVAVNGFLKTVPYAKIRVCAVTDTTTPCTPVSIYSDPALSIVKANPITADKNGEYTYCAATDNYNEQISGTNIVGVNNQPTTISPALNSGYANVVANGSSYFYIRKGSTAQDFRIYKRYSGGGAQEWLQTIFDSGSGHWKSRGGQSLGSLYPWDFSLNGGTIDGLADPSNPQDAATKAYVDAHSGSGGSSDFIVDPTQAPYNAKCDAMNYSAISTTAGSKTVISAGSVFKSTDVGKEIRIYGAGTAGAQFVTKITGYTSGTSITVQDNAPTSVTNRGAVWATNTDESSALNAALLAIVTNGGGKLRIPPTGGCSVASTLVASTTGTPWNTSYSVNVAIEGLGYSAYDGSRLLWAGAANGDLIRKGEVGDATKTVTLEVSGIRFDSVDSYAKTAIAGAFINTYFGMMDNIHDNYFGVAVNHVQTRGTYIAKYDHNFWYGATGSCFYAPNDDAQASINGNFIEHNEFGACGRYDIENVSQGAGGSNQNVYAHNDFEGAVTGSLGSVYLIDSNSKVESNRWEDLTAKTAGFRELTMLGSANTVTHNEFGSASPMEYAVSILGTAANNLFQGNNWTGNGTIGSIEMATSGKGNRSEGEVALYRAMIGGTYAVNFEIKHSTTALIDAEGIKLFRSGDLSNTRKWNTLQIYAYGITFLPSNGLNPSAPAPYGGMTGAQFINGDVVYNASYAGNASWVCVTSTCTWDGAAWTGTWSESGMISSRKRREGTAAPVSGTWVAGDYVWNTNPTTGIKGWLCTAGGTPGTWIADNAIDPTALGATGVTTLTASGLATLNGAATVSSPTASTVPLTIKAAASMTPSQVTSATLAASYDANTSDCTVDGTATGTWTDQTAGGHNLTQATAANKPLCKTNVQNGKNVFRFDGSNDYFKTAGFTLNQPVTVYAIAKKTTGAGPLSMFDGNTQSSMLFYFPSAAKVELYANSGSNTVPNGGAGATITDNGLFSVWKLVYNGASTCVYRDGVQLACGNGGATNPGGLAVGSNASGSSNFNGDIGEFHVFSGTVSTAEDAALTNAFATKWGITAITPANLQQWTASDGTTVKAAVDQGGKGIYSSLNIGGGSDITKHLSTTAVLDFPAITTPGCSDLTATVTGAAIGDTVALGVPQDAITIATIYNGWVNAADTVTIRACALTGTSPNPSSATFRIDVWKH